MGLVREENDDATGSVVDESSASSSDEGFSIQHMRSEWESAAVEHTLGRTPRQLAAIACKTARKERKRLVKEEQRARRARAQTINMSTSMYKGADSVRRKRPSSSRRRFASVSTHRSHVAGAAERTCGELFRELEEIFGDNLAGLSGLSLSSDDLE